MNTKGEKKDPKFENLPNNIQIYPFVDQIAVLSITDIFITHCGMNSASEGLYFEVPLILCPQTPEEIAVAKRTDELGAGIWLKSVNQSSDISNAIDSFKACGGVKVAKEFLETISLKSK